MVSGARWPGCGNALGNVRWTKLIRVTLVNQRKRNLQQLGQRRSGYTSRPSEIRYNPVGEGEMRLCLVLALASMIMGMVGFALGLHARWQVKRMRETMRHQQRVINSSPERL
jgi:hypothetical protein